MTTCKSQNHVQIHLSGESNWLCWIFIFLDCNLSGGNYFKNTNHHHISLQQSSLSSFKTLCGTRATGICWVCITATKNDPAAAFASKQFLRLTPARTPAARQEWLTWWRMKHLGKISWLRIKWDPSHQAFYRKPVNPCPFELYSGKNPNAGNTNTNC